MNITDKKRTNPLVLVVDDDPTITFLVRAKLNRIGLDVIEAENGLNGINLFIAEKPDIILLDVTMPEMDGFEVCKCIRRSSGGSYVQILMMTGLEDTKSMQKAFDAGADGFLAKPINLSMLSQRVQYTIRAGKAFRESYIYKNRLTKTQELAKIGNWQVDLRTNDFYCSSEASKLLSLTDRENINTLDKFLSSVIPEDKKVVKETFKNAMKSQKAVNLEYQIKTSSGFTKHILNKSEILVDEEDLPVIFLGVIQDITELKDAYRTIKKMSITDDLTKIYNRRYFHHRLDDEVKRVSRYNRPLSLLIVDIDYFKKINDLYGHPVGDDVLVTVADMLNTNVRNVDVTARYGGEEFVIIMPETNAQDAYTTGEKLRKKIELHTFELPDGRKFQITASFGVSSINLLHKDIPDKAKQLIKNADDALYDAKESGRNSVMLYT